MSLDAIEPASSAWFRIDHDNPIIIEMINKYSSREENMTLLHHAMSRKEYARTIGRINNMLKKETAAKLKSLCDKINEEQERRKKEVYFEIILEEVSSGFEVIRLKISVSRGFANKPNEVEKSSEGKRKVGGLELRAVDPLPIGAEGLDAEEEFPDEEELFTPRDGPGSKAAAASNALKEMELMQVNKANAKNQQKVHGTGPRGLRNLDVDELCDLLRAHGLGEYAPNFAMHQVHGDTFCDFDEEDLADKTYVNVKDAKHREILLDWIESGQMPNEEDEVPELMSTPRVKAAAGDHLFTPRGTPTRQSNGTTSPSDSGQEADKVPLFFSQLNANKAKEAQESQKAPKKDGKGVSLDLNKAKGMNGKSDDGPQESARDIFKRVMDLEEDIDRVNHKSRNAPTNDGDDSDDTSDDGMGVLAPVKLAGAPSESDDDSPPPTSRSKKAAKTPRGKKNPVIDTSHHIDPDNEPEAPSPRSAAKERRRIQAKEASKEDPEDPWAQDDKSDEEVQARAPSPELQRWGSEPEPVSPKKSSSKSKTKKSSKAKEKDDEGSIGGRIKVKEIEAAIKTKAEAEAEAAEQMVGQKVDERVVQSKSKFPQKSAGTTSAKNLGVVGGSKKRITIAPTAASTTSSSSNGLSAFQQADKASSFQQAAKKQKT